MLLQRLCHGNILSVENQPMKVFSVEVNLRKTKWLLCCSHNLNKTTMIFTWKLCAEVSVILITLRKLHYNRRFFNFSNFRDTCDLKRIIKKPTCCRNPNKPSYIELILTNKPRRLKHSCVTEKVLSDFHKATSQGNFSRQRLQIFWNYKFRIDLLSELSKINCWRKWKRIK